MNSYIYFSTKSHLALKSFLFWQTCHFFFFLEPQISLFSLVVMRGKAVTDSYPFRLKVTLVRVTLISHGKNP